MNSQDALIIVDVQIDFCPGGALPIEEGNDVVPVLNQWIHKAHSSGARIVASRDWHPSDHISFRQQGGVWPPHCIQGTHGADLHADLQLTSETRIISKGVSTDKDSYSAFDGTGLADQLRRQGVERLWIGGLAQDVCVRATVLDGCRAGFEVHLINNATRPVDADAGRQALKEMQKAGAIIVEDGPREENRASDEGEQHG